ncbi:MAG: tRNA dimethylallyltransferase [Phycisphaerae bacterium]|nr:tRNA dimethylallyltransferase [Phycisphaerae bacterium]
MMASASVKQQPLLHFIIGCTACGKSQIALELVQRVHGEIISIDSMQVYRRMNIGTAKPTAAERALVPHHLVDVVEPWEEFNVAKYIAQAHQIIAEIAQRQRPIFIVGGTALYIKGLVEGLFEGPGEDPQFRLQLRDQYQQSGPDAVHQQLQRVDPESARRIHPNDYQRLERALEIYHLTHQPISSLQQQWEKNGTRFPCRFLGLRRGKEDQSRRINQRVRDMMAAGLLQEVQALQNEPHPLSAQASQALGYAELFAHLRGEWSLEDAVEKIKIHSRRLAKHQRTWFRRFPQVHWVDIAPDQPPTEIVAAAEVWYHAAP